MDFKLLKTPLIYIGLIILLVSHRSFSQKSDFILFSGKTVDAQTGENLAGTAIYFSGVSLVAISDSLGQFSITLPANKYAYGVRRVGYKFQYGKIDLSTSQEITFQLEESTKLLDEVIISTERSDQSLKRAISGVERMSSKTLRRMPTLMGEVDVVRSILALPGVSTIGEGASGFNVRGGNVDQNLVLLDGVPLYNTSHLFGFFTSFNSNLVSDLSLYKGGIPSTFGGRSSSVLNVRLKEGDFEKWNKHIGLGPLSSQITLDGPLKTNKTSILLGARSSLSDFYLGFFPGKDIAKSKANFYDFNLKLSQQINQKNKIALGYYQSGDLFRFGIDTSYFWNTKSINLKFNSLINAKLSNSFIAFYSDYEYGIKGTKANLEFEWNPRIKQQSVKDILTYEASKNHSYEIGLEINLYENNQGSFHPTTENSIIQNFNMPIERAKDAAIFLNSNYHLGDRVNLTLGFRYSVFGNYGEAVKLKYAENSPRTPYSVIDTLNYTKGKLIQSYGGFEPRLSISYQLTEYSSFKLGYNRVRQYMHLLSNTMAISPVDIWKFSDSYVKPQVVDQYSAGIFKNWDLVSRGSFESSIETYYKAYQNIIDYIDGANLYLNPSVETELLNARGRSYGLEFMLKKSRGLRTTGWVSYAYSRSFRQSITNQEQLGANFGKEFPSNFDIPHSIKFVWNYRLNRRFSFNANFNYSSGRPITFPNGRYKIYAFNEVYHYAYANGIFPREGLVPKTYSYRGREYTFLEIADIAPVLDGYSTPSFTLRNQERIPFYMRLDVGITIEPKGGNKKEQSWNFSIYNLLSRANVYSIFFRSSTGTINQARAFELSVLGAAIPSITYHIKF